MFKFTFSVGVGTGRKKALEGRMSDLEQRLKDAEARADAQVVALKEREAEYRELNAKALQKANDGIAALNAQVALLSDPERKAALEKAISHFDGMATALAEIDAATTPAAGSGETTGETPAIGSGEWGPTPSGGDATDPPPDGASGGTGSGSEPDPAAGSETSGSSGTEAPAG